MLGWPGGPYPGWGPGEAELLIAGPGPLPSLAPLAGRGGMGTPSRGWPMAGLMDRELEEPVGDGLGLGLGEGDGLGRGDPDCLTAGSALSGLPSSLLECPPAFSWNINNIKKMKFTNIKAFCIDRSRRVLSDNIN